MSRHIDPLTGEIMESVTLLKRHDEVVVKFRPKEKGRKGKRFVKLFSSRDAKRQARKLTLQENGFIRLLAMYVSPDTNIIVGDGDIGTTGLPLSFAQMVELSGLSQPTFLKILRNLTEIGVIEKVDGRAYRLHPEIACVRLG